MSLRARIAALLRDLAARAPAPSRRTTAVVVQEIRNVQVRAPAGCPPTSRLVTRADAALDVDVVVDGVRALAMDVAVDGIAAIVLEEARVTLSTATRALLASALAQRTDTLIQREVLPSQVVRYVDADVCDIEPDIP